MKGQTSFEFALILAIVLITTAILITFSLSQPKFSQSTASTTTDAYWHTADISILSHKANGQAMGLVLRNNLPFPITLTQININEFVTPVNISMTPGQEETITANYTHNSTTQGYLYTAFPAFTYSTQSGRTITFYGQQPLQGRIS